MNNPSPAGQKRGPFTVLSSREVYRNPWIRVQEDKIIRPDGKEGIYGTVTQGKGVAILPMDNDGNVWLVKQFRYGVNRETIEAVSGGMDGKETPLEAAKRELKEEVGATADEWTDFGTTDVGTSALLCTEHLFLAKELHFSSQEICGDESSIDLVKMPFVDAVRMVMSGEITLASSAAFILKAAQKLNIRYA
jgi:8-oxo-dGTP pyrophosphatase MutT (NUDIX family)